MGLTIYNSLTNKMEEFKPINGNKVNMYVCGPTVYNYIHIGNARPVIFFDMLKRYLQFLGYDVTYASNITDIDDKIINKAIKENVTEKEITTKYEKAFFDCVSKVGSKKPDEIPHATEYINEMINFIAELVFKGYAYNVDGDVYFRINKIADYGCLSNQVQEELNQGVRIDVSDKKENPLDFTLWKKTDKGIKWDSPFGPGRPGWHTECVVMNHKIFGDCIDIHGGGMDLKFPHHENEIAQSEALYNNHLAKYWMHVGRLDFNGEKMSKSLGNVILVNDMTSEEAKVLRMLIVFSPYRNSINYTEALQNQYKNEYEKFKRTYQMALRDMQVNHIDTKDLDEEAIAKFKEYMNQDFNVQNVLTLSEELVKAMNMASRSKDYNTLALKTNTFKTIIDVLGIDFDVKLMNEEDLAIYTKWIDARNKKDFALADEYRKILMEKGLA